MYNFPAQYVIFKVPTGYKKEPGTECVNQMPGLRYQHLFDAEKQCNEELKCGGIHVVCGKFETFQLCSGNELSKGSIQENCEDLVFMKPGKFENF